MELVNQIDFKPIGRKFQSGEALNDAEKSAVFSVALEHANKLIKAKTDSAQSLIPADMDNVGRFIELPQVVKDYVSGALLGRIVDLHARAVDAATPEAEAFGKFIDLKEAVFEKLLVDPDNVSDEKFNTLVNEESKKYMDKRFSPEIKDNLNTVREMLRIVVANNPSSQVKGLKYTLD